MALELIIIDKVTGQAITVDPDSGGLLVANRALGYDKQYQITAITGTIAAALGANSVLFAMRNSATSNAAQMLHIQRIRLNFTTITAFTTPVTAARRLEVIKALASSSGPYSGGTAIASAVKKVTASLASQADSANGGDIRIASTGALTAPTTANFDAYPLGVMPLTHLGSAGANGEKVIDLIGVNDQPWEVAAGEMLVVRNPVAMDAGGTWQLEVEVDFYQN